MEFFILWTAMLGQPMNEPPFALHTIKNQITTGVVEKLEPSGVVVINGQPSIAVPEIVALRRLDLPTPPWPREPHLLLANGDRIVGQPIGVNGSFLLMRVEGNRGEHNGLRIPLTAISVLWLRSSNAATPDRLKAALTAERSDDLIILRNGDVLGGVLTGFDADKKDFAFQTGGSTRTIAIDKATAIAFSTKLARPRKPAGPYAHLVLTNGSRITLLSPAIASGELRGQTMYKDNVLVALKDVAALDIYQGKAVFLSDLKPAKYEYRSYQGERHEWSADRSLGGRELQLKSPSGIVTFDKGLAVHGECNLSFALDEKYRWFECFVGLDPEGGKRGNAIVRLFVDGCEVKINDGKPITLANAMLPVRVDVAKAKNLKLIVEWGDGGYVGDRVNWADARLLP